MPDEKPKTHFQAIVDHLLSRMEAEEIEPEPESSAEELREIRDQERSDERRSK